MDDHNNPAPSGAPDHGIKEASSEGHLDTLAARVAPPAPQVLNGIKIYPPSFVPTKGILVYPKKTLIQMELEHIEGIHIACFLGLTVFLFIGMWKRPDLR